MSKDVRLLGHPVHQMLIVFPLGLLATSLLFDVLYLITDNPEFSITAYWLIAAGLVGALIAAVFGIIDWIAVPKNTRAKAIGAWHGLGNGLVALLFLGSWLIRRNSSLPGHDAVILSACGVALSWVTAWLGGELVVRMGIGVDEGANPNAPSSLRTDNAHSRNLRTSH